MNHYDVIVIGTGAANIITDAAQRQGLRIAVVERDRFGGTCLNRGCIPTKIMVTAANVVREMEEARRIGVYADNVRMDWDVITRRLWHKINENSAIKDYYAAFPNVDVYEGTASFTGKKSLHIAMNDGTPDIGNAVRQQISETALRQPAHHRRRPYRLRIRPCVQRRRH